MLNMKDSENVRDTYIDCKLQLRERTDSDRNTE